MRHYWDLTIPVTITITIITITITFTITTINITTKSSVNNLPAWEPNLGAKRLQT